jgi:isoamylase
MTAVAAGTPDTLPGSQFPLGATVTATGTNFAVASGVADGMLLCLFDEAGAETRIPVLDCDAGVWHVFVPGVGPGQAYGYRATGPYDPARGIRCHPAKLLLDPYARAVSGTVTFGPEVLGYSGSDQDVPNEADSAPCVPRSVVVADELFPWRDGARRGYAYADTIVYEMHVKGFTMRHPGVPPELRGTYAGLGHAAAIAHLLDLGVTAVELLPVHESVPEAFLVRDGLTNYWGYNTIGYFAPNQAYSAAVRAGQPGGQVDEFKAMVDALHAAGIEVILDVVFNHTAEGDHTGPTLCFRGLDNPAYYRLDPSDPRCYLDTTGCGNSLNAGDPLTLPGCSSSPGGSSPCARPTRCSAATVSWPEPRPPTCNGSPRPAPGWPTPTGRTRTPWPSRCTWTDRTPPTGPPTAPG